MKHKKKIALGLIGVILASIFPSQVVANPQQNVGKFWLSEPITHERNTTQDKIYPTLGFSWNPPANKLPGAPGTDDDHEVGFYKVKIQNKHTGDILVTDKYTNTTTAPGNLGPQTLFFDIMGQSIDKKINSGALYEATVLAGHYHEVKVGDKIEIKEILSGPSNEVVKFVTDFNTQVATANKGLKVSWEYIPGMEYELVYAKDETGAHTTEKQVRDNKRGRRLITAGEAEDLVVKRNGKEYVEYTLQGLDPKSKYSLFVEPYVESGLGIKQNDYTDAKGPKVVAGMTAISLSLEIISATSLKLLWGTIPAEAFGSEIVRVVAEGRPTAKQTPFEELAEKNNVTGNLLTHIIVERPSVETEYRVAFYFKGKEEPIYSDTVIYTPNFEEVPPYSPKIPELYIKDENITEAKTKVDYLVTGDTIAWDSEVSWKDLAFMKRTFHADFNVNPYIQIVWDAPKKVGEDKVVDYRLFYDVWIGEDFEEVSKPNYDGLVYNNYAIMEDSKDNLIEQHNSPKEIIGMKLKIEQDEKGDPLKRNKTYYIKIVAKKRVPGTENTYIPSQPTVVGVTIDKDGNITKPPVLGKPPLQIKEGSIKTNAMTIEWTTLWAEILANNPDLYTDKAERSLAETGSSDVYVVGTDKDDLPIRFKPQPGIKSTELYGKEKTEIEKLIGTLPMANYYSRFLNLDKDVSYEVAVESYDTLHQRIGNQSIEEWMKEEAKDDKVSGLVWESATPRERTKIEDAPYNSWLEYDINHATVDGKPLKPNTRYIIMLRAYRMVDGEKLVQSFPSYVMGTTLTDFPTIEPVPIAPTIKVVGQTDHSLDVEWLYNKDFDYEIRYSTGNDPEKAKVWDFKVVGESGLQDSDKNMYYFNDGKPAVVTIRGLFPETVYNVWIRAKQKKGTLISAYSSPATGETDPLKVPEVPRGLGPASKVSLKELGLDYPPTGKDYIAIEWMKNPDDRGVQTEENITKSYSYDIMFSDNVEFIDGEVVTVTDALQQVGNVEMLAKSIVRYTKLLPNRPYYFKVKARVTLKDAETGKVLNKESAYSKSVRIFTSKTDDEYDGGENDNIIIYPDQIVEDYKNGIWEWEIVDEQGIISQIVTSNEYFFTIDVVKYKDKYDARLRRLKLPAPVVQALVGQKMEIKIMTQVGAYEIPAKHIAYTLEKAQAEDTIVFELETMLAYDLKDIAKPYPYIVEGGEALTIYHESNKYGTKKLQHFDGPIDVYMKLSDSQAYQYDTYKTYTYESVKGDWIGKTHQVSTIDNTTYLKAINDKTGIYALYRIDTYHHTSDINYGMQQLLANYEINGLGVKYKQNDVVHSDQYITLLLGMAKGHRTIDLEQGANSTLREQARQTKIYSEPSAGYITQEVAIQGIIRLYEMQTGYRVKPASRTFSNVASRYQESVQKAYALGIISDISPKKQVSYGQLSEWLLMVMSE